MDNTKSITEKRDLTVIASEINAIKMQVQQTMLLAAVDIGKRLVEAKASVEHGSWGKWLKESVDYSERTAQNLMRLFQEYGQGQEKLFGKCIEPQTLAGMTYTQALSLLSIKDSDERAEFVEQHNVAEMSTRELEQAIKDRDKAIADAAQVKKDMAEIKTTLARERTEHQKVFDKIMAENKEADEKQRSDMERRLHQKETELGKAQAAAEKLQAEKQQLEIALQEKPIETTAEIVPDKPDAAAIAEIERLKAEVANLKTEQEKSSADDTAIELFRNNFKALQDKFNELIDIAEKMTPEHKENYLRAVGKLADMIKSKVE